MPIKDYILGLGSLALFIGLWTWFGFWWAFLGLFIYYCAISLWHVWENPEMIIMWDSFTAAKYDPKFDNKWYAKLIRNTIGVPIYWFVDKLQEKAKRKEEAGEYD